MNLRPLLLLAVCLLGWAVPAGAEVRALTGPWDFFWERAVGPDDQTAVPDAQVRLPDGLWQNILVRGKPFPNTGYATYRLRFEDTVSGERALQLPEAFSAMRVLVNGAEVFRAGSFGTTEAASASWYRTGVVRFAARAGTNEILIQVSNFAERRGGLGRTPLLGNPTEIESGYLVALSVDLIIFAVLAAMGLYHLVLFALRRSDRTPLWFGLFCLAIALRTLLYGERFLFTLAPGVPWSVFQIADHLTFYWGIPLFAGYLFLLLPQTLSRWFIRIYQTAGVGFSAFLFFPPAVFNTTVVGYEVVTACSVLYVFFALARAAVRQEPGALVTVVGVVVFLFAGVNEILYNIGVVHTFNSLAWGLVILIFSQAALLAQRSALAFSESERLGTRLAETNRALRRFIPEEFFTVLNAKEVTDIKLGDQVQRNMSVLFSDIRGFTTLAERLSSQETFRFLNSYYGRAGLVMRRHGGFIDKYFGDGFMTLFPGKPDDALGAAVDLQVAVAEYNAHRAHSGYPAISVGTGLHYGPLVLGTIGEQDRMDTTVIADAVNLASRLEGLTKIYGKGTIVTLGFLDNLERPEDFHWRYLGMIRVPGRKEAVEAVHVYDGLPDEERLPFEEGKKDFEEALALYRNSQFAEARTAFVDLAGRYPEDPAINTLLTRISLMLKAGLSQDWDGVDSVMTK